jgi:hypothetical protein
MRNTVSRISEVLEQNRVPGRLIGGLILAGAISISSSGPAQTSTATGKPVRSSASRPQPDRFAGRAGRYYALIWGVDQLSVKAVESGELVRFSYRVIDPQKAKVLNDKKFDPALIFPDARIKLVIPSLEKVGQLRQSSTPEAGKSYWMAFSNPHREVKRGDRVNVVIGQFHADGLFVD